MDSGPPAHGPAEADGLPRDRSAGAAVARCHSAEPRFGAAGRCGPTVQSGRAVRRCDRSATPGRTAHGPDAPDAVRAYEVHETYGAPWGGRGVRARCVRPARPRPRGAELAGEDGDVPVPVAGPGHGGRCGEAAREGLGRTVARGDRGDLRVPRGRVVEGGLAARRPGRSTGRRLPTEERTDARAVRATANPHVTAPRTGPTRPERGPPGRHDGGAGEGRTVHHGDGPAGSPLLGGPALRARSNGPRLILRVDAGERREYGRPRNLRERGPGNFRKSRKVRPREGGQNRERGTCGERGKRGESQPGREGRVGVRVRQGGDRQSPTQYIGESAAGPPGSSGERSYDRPGGRRLGSSGHRPEDGLPDRPDRLADRPDRPHDLGYRPLDTLGRRPSLDGAARVRTAGRRAPTRVGRRTAAWTG